MALVDTVFATVHLLVGAFWVGNVAFLAGVVLPGARDDGLDAAPLESMVGSLTRWSRVASAAVLVTGGHLAATGYTAETLASTTNGNLVVAMVALWVALTGLVEAGGGRLRDGLSRRKVREPAASALGLYRGAAVVGALLLVTAGAITT
jgi:uncharacterized membrane protein